ncbi:hypothetical protein WAE58_04370 [Pedobacter panaciterrae]|uniref:Nucleotidyltransferase n=1 Tax=Pedobacter panaciterrae TaxID=363849 RepID=A0ABU8NHD0_9SPHI
MALTVNESFKEFNKDFVNLKPERTILARSSRDWLINQLLNLPGKVDFFPSLYANMSIKYGSFARNSKIHPLDDIDLLLTFSADGATYTTHSFGKRYTLNVPQTAGNLYRLTNEDGSLNSIKFVNKLVSAISQIEHYKSAETHRRQEAATLNLSSYEWNFDIVPSFYTDTGYYLIPDGSGQWKASDPRVDQELAEKVNKQHSGKITQIIRLLKYWSKNTSMPTIPSYFFEIMILKFFENRAEVSDWIDVNLINFWTYFKTEIWNGVQDPKGFQGNLNTLEFEEILKIISKVKEAEEKAREAYKLETVDKDQKRSIEKWAEIFGSDFPVYG